jgi:hypothetical protein
MTRPAIHRASAALSAAVTVGESRAFAAWNALTGISTAGSTAVTVRKPRDDWVMIGR